MSSLEEPLNLDRLPSLSNIDLLERFSSGACRPVGEDMAMGDSWSDGRNCSSSNNCIEDDEEYGRENFKWRRHGSRNVIPSRRSKSLSKNYIVCGTVSRSQCLTDRQPISYSNQRSTVNKTFKLFNGMPNHVKIVEVGPRDGLQNEKNTVPTSVKVELVQKLVSCGLPVVEVTGFVSPKWVPQLSDAKDVMEAVKNLEGARLPVLTPNMKVCILCYWVPSRRSNFTFKSRICSKGTS